MVQQSVVVGIDLGTTNSEVAAFVDGDVKVLGPRDSVMLPSCVGLSPAGELLVGQAARNQSLVYPERTVRSIKRKMGEQVSVRLGDRLLTPPDLSACILRQLSDWAQKSLGQIVERAVITVPAYFSDAQRQATREAGHLAGLEVLRILNEPTAASLAYGFGSGHHTALVYDLGGGTFDVSVVAVEGDVTEVLASHGNNHLGGDDFDGLLVEFLVQRFQQQYGIDLRQGHAAAMARLWWAAEAAKKELSFEPYAMVREESLLVEDGKPLHLAVEVSREAYEAMIAPLVESTLNSVGTAFDDARKRPQDIDAILLVGGSTRTPMVSRLLVERTEQVPRQDVHPDLCVALGAGVLASRLAGHDVSKVLVDVSPYTFGTSYLGERDGYEDPYCYKPIILRNTPLPVTRTETFYTAHEFQTTVQVDVYQGDEDNALLNQLVGEFNIEDLTRTADPNEVMCRMNLDLDGILNVTAIERKTGRQKGITLVNAFKERTEAETAAAREESRALFMTRAEEVAEFELRPRMLQPVLSPVSSTAYRDALAAVERARGLQGQMHADDVEEAVDLQRRIEAAVQADDSAQVEEALAALNELLFFVESR